MYFYLFHRKLITVLTAVRRSIAVWNHGFQSLQLLNTRMVSCVCQRGRRRECVSALTVTPVKNVLVVTDGWENGTDARKDGQMNDRTVEGDSLL